jgi:hypothetical protein
VIGGTLSKLSGGKFANGAVTAAMSYAFNQLAHHHLSADGGGGETAEDRMLASVEYDLNKAMAFHWPSLPQGLVDFSAGMGDTASFGLTQYIRDRSNIDGGIDYASDEYTYGGYAGVLGAVGTTAAGGFAFNVGVRAVGGARTLYHFTSVANAAGIAESGVIRASARGVYGSGVYFTSLNSAGYATVSGAASTQSVIVVPAVGLRVTATPWPFTFRVPAAVRVP